MKSGSQEPTNAAGRQEQTHARTKKGGSLRERAICDAENCACCTEADDKEELALSLGMNPGALGQETDLLALGRQLVSKIEAVSKCLEHPARRRTKHEEEVLREKFRRFTSGCGQSHQTRVA